MSWNPSPEVAVARDAAKKLDDAPICAMKAKHPTLFEIPSEPRAKPRVMMHTIDAGAGDELPCRVHFQCGKCGHDDGWHEVATWTEGKRGLPCPKCNQ
jgi:hypothetical protein